MTRFSNVTLIPATAALMLAACGGDPSRPDTTTGQAGPDRAEPQVVMEQDLGGIRSQTGANLNLPDGFPDDVAHYPGLNIYGANAIPNMGFSLAAIADGAMADVADFYAREMPALGWSMISNGPSGPGHLLQFEKDGRSTAINLIPNGASTTVSVTALN